MKNLWIGMLTLLMVLCIASCKKSDQPEASKAGEATEQMADLKLEDIVAKAKAEGAKWTEDEWKAAMKGAMTAVAPAFKKIGELQAKIGDDPAKAVESIGELQKLMEEFEPYEKLFDELDSIADASEIGKAVAEDTVFEKEVMKELGIDGIDL